MLKKLNILLLLTSFSLLAQSQYYTPYSRYGLGITYQPSFGAVRGMADLGSVYRSKINMNAFNPASYAALEMATFEVGVNADGAGITLQDTTYRVMNGTLSQIAVAFPVFRNRWGIVAGLVPYSRLNYGFVENRMDTSLNTTYSKVFTGQGSTYNFFVGNGVRLGPVSVGANLGLVFGKYNYDKYINIPDSIQAMNARNSDEVRFRSFNYNVGVQFHKAINSRNESDSTIYVTVGATVSGGHKLKIKRSEVWQRFVNVTYLNSSIVTVIDTPYLTNEADDYIQSPLMFSTGIMFGNEKKWLVGTEFRFTNWDNFKTPLENGQVKNSWRFSIGGQILPDYQAKKNLFKVTQYKAGFYIGQSEILHNGQNLNEIGGTLGFAFPLRSFGRLNIAGDFGTRGYNNSGAIRESYYRIHFGIVINDIWFIKRKYE